MAHGLSERCGPGSQPGAPLTDLVLCLAQLRHLSRCGLDGRGCAFMRGDKLGPVRVAAAEVILQLPVLLLSPLGPRPGGGKTSGQPACLFPGGSKPAPGRSGLATKPGESLGPLSGRPRVGGYLALGLGDGSFRRCPGRHRSGQLLAGGAQPVAQAALLLAQHRRLTLQRAGVTAGPRGLRGRRQVAVPLRCQVGDRSQPLGQPAEREVRFLRDGQPGRILLLGRLELGLLQTRRRQHRLEFGPQRGGGGLLGLVPGEFPRQRNEVVGEQPEPRVAQVGLDHRRLAGELRLAAERLELAAKFRGEIDQPGHVGLHRLELAEGLLLAPAVLEDARCFLDQRPPRLRSGVEYVV